MNIYVGTSNSTERYTQADSWGSGAEPGAVGRNDQRFRHHELRVLFTDLSQRVLRLLPAEICLTLHNTRQCSLRRSCRRSWYVCSSFCFIRWDMRNVRSNADG